MSSHTFLIEYFNYTHPTPSELFRDKLPVNLNRYLSIKDEDIFNAVLSATPRQVIILPDSYRRRLLEVDGHNLERYKPQNQHLVHWRYAPDVVLNTTRMGVKDAQRERFTLRDAIKDASWN